MDFRYLAVGTRSVHIYDPNDVVCVCVCVLLVRSLNAPPTFLAMSFRIVQVAI